MPDESSELEFHRALLDAAGDAIIVQDGIRIIDCNNAALELFKCSSKTEFLRSTPADWAPPAQPDGGASRSWVNSNNARALKQGSHRFDWMACDHEGREFASEVWLTRFKWGDRTLLRAAIRDLGEQRLSEQRSCAYFESLFDNSAEGIIIVDDGDTIVDANPGFERMFQYSRAELIGRNLNEYIVPRRLRGQAASYSQRALDGVTDAIGDTVRVRKDGSELRVAIMGAPVAIDGRQIGVCGIYRDMTVYFRNQARLRETEARLRAVVENLPVVLFMLDCDGKFTLSQGLGLKKIGRDPDETVGRSIFDVHPGQPQLFEAFKAALQGETSVVSHDYGDVIFETQFSPLADAAGDIIGAIGLARDVSEYREFRRRLEYMAHHDALTQLPNRTMFREHMSQAMERAQHAATSFAILVVDLNRFKTINDSLGHDAGDRVLRAVAERFAKSLRATDIIARLGGDEFAVLIEDVSNPRRASVVARKLIDALTKPLPAADIQLNVSARVGISMYPNDGNDVDTLLTSADAAMHAAAESRDSYRFFSANMNSSALESLLLGNSLRVALDRHEFLLHYQPVVDLASDEVTGFEALVRWQHPERGLVAPGQFIPLAEDMGLIAPLGEMVMQEACQQMRKWRRQGHADLRMAVNLSAKQFRDWHFVERLGAIIRATGVPADRLLIEITESIMLPQPRQTHKILNKISDMGMPIAIDDFGTGYSSLAYLRDFSIDYLKIDRSFVSSVPEDRNACTIVNTIIVMAKSLDLKVIAEGVETIEQLDFLRASGCDEAQGFYLGKPMPAAQAEALLDKLVLLAPSSA